MRFGSRFVSVPRLQRFNIEKFDRRRRDPKLQRTEITNKFVHHEVRRAQWAVQHHGKSDFTHAWTHNK